ncbi:hypothetical protein OEZ85_014271 [Tetradesmus obliquus]|uniref:Cytochrome P450 n=1 Tax=Tetradesmus obliquus TaxID=3088 RepID=A0ABY8UCL8_TETOB|nr:hypothetical protein OEZ85_014271 [Tetradesmus obliquus]
MNLIHRETQYEPVPAVRGGLPYIGVLHRTPVNQLFSFVEREFAETGVRCLDLQVFGRHAVYTRHPEDIGSVLRNPSKWTKAPLMMKRLDRWLGEGLVSELDPARHAAARDVLAPAFRAQSVKDLVPLFADVGQQLAAALLSQAGSTIELEPITRRATLDVIGRAGFGHDFGALQMAQQQQQQQDQVDVVKLFDDILDTSMLLIMNPPLPDALVPGHSSYSAAVDALEAVALRLLQERRQQGISPQDRSLLSFMLAAQQAAPGGLVSDKHIRDQLMTFMLAGSDTSATILAFCLYELARRPEAQQAVRQELQQVLEDTPIDQLQPDAFSSLPYLTGCINECLRLYPAAPGLARIPQQDAVLGPHLIPQGLPVVVDFFSCHSRMQCWGHTSSPKGCQWWWTSSLVTAAPGLARIPQQDAVLGPHLIPQGLPVVVDFFSCHSRMQCWGHTSSPKGCQWWWTSSLVTAAPGLARIPQQDAVLGPHLIPQGLPVVVDFFSCHSRMQCWGHTSSPKGCQWWWTSSLVTAAPGLARIPQQDAVLGPHLIPQGLPVVVDFFSCHRHPEFWPRASEWLPERWLPSNLKALGPQHPDAFMPFSAGSRSCIGRYFAMLEMQVMLAVVLRQLSFAAVGGEGSGQAAAAQSFTLKSRDGLRVVPTAAGR